MSGDRRTVSTDALETLGKLIGQNEKRDAIHLAVLPVLARLTLEPGASISCTSDGEAYDDPDGIGIVDPFLPEPVQLGERFWMILRPRLITSLRHVWTHPALPDEGAPDADARKSSEEWLRNFCDDGERPSYEFLIKSLCDADMLEGDSFHIDGEDASGEIPPEFWDHAEIVTGRRFVVRPTFFSCGC